MMRFDLRPITLHMLPLRRPRWGLRIAIVLLAAMVLGPASSYAQQVGNNWSEPVDATLGSTAQMGSFDLLLCDPYQNTYLLGPSNRTTAPLFTCAPTRTTAGQPRTMSSSRPARSSSAWRRPSPSQPIRCT